LAYLKGLIVKAPLPEVFENIRSAIFT